MRFSCIALLIFISLAASSQSIDSLMKKLDQLELKTNEIDLRMEQTQKQFQSGILVSTLGYSITIAGGLMLGRENDQLGQVLLVAGGVTGVTGPYILVDSFRLLSGRRKKSFGRR